MGGGNKGGNAGGGPAPAPIANTQQRNTGQGSNVAQQECQGFDLASSGFSGWGDISSNAGGDQQGYTAMGNTEQRNNGQGNIGNASAAAPEQKPREGKATKSFLDEDVYGPKDMDRWADIKEYDDDHDSDWFEEENKRLAKLYGGNFIYVKYLDSQPGRVGYYCQLCSAEMNARKSLELHCSGMKHLKRKDQWEKGDLSQEIGHDEKGLHKPNRPARDRYHSPHRSDRGNSRGDPYGGRGSSRGPTPDYRDRAYSDRRDDYKRYSDSYYDDYYRRDMYRPPYDRDPYDARRSPPDMRHDYDHPGPARRDADRYPRDRYNPYGRREAPPPPVISGPPAPAPAAPAVAPRPPAINDVAAVNAILFEGISDGSCNELLKKLSSCRVKSWEDAVLATNVANFLITSLREYYSKTGPATTVHVLDEIVLKINIMKNLMKNP